MSSSYSGYAEHYHQHPEVNTYSSVSSPKPATADYSDLETQEQGYGAAEIPSSPRQLHQEPKYQQQYERSQPLPQKQRTICGLRAVTFWLVLAVVFFIIVAAALGGGLGGELASVKSSNNNVINTPNSKGTRTKGGDPAASSQIPSSGITRLYCTNRTIYEVSKNEKFEQFCGVDWAEGIPAQLGGDVHDIKIYGAGSYHYCMQLCVDYNNQKADTAQKCNAIAYDSDLTEAIGEKQSKGNCWLKSSAGKYTSLTGPFLERYACAKLL